MKRSAAVGALAFGLAFFFISWFLWSDSRHFIEGGDIFFPLDPALVLSKIVHSWWPDQMGSVAYTISAAPVYLCLTALRELGVSAVAIDRLLLAACYGISASGMYLLAARFWTVPSAAWVAALWYPCGIYYCQAVPNENNVVALAIMPLLTFLALRSLEQPLYILGFDVLSLGLGYISANPPTLMLSVLIVAVLWILGSQGRFCRRQRVLTAALLVATSLAVNLWWIDAARIAVAANQIVAAGVSDWSWVLRRSTLLNVVEQTSFWGFGYASDPWLTIGKWYENSVVGQVALLATPFLAFLGLVLGRNSPDRARVWALAVLSIVAIILAKGTHAPFGWFNLFLYRHLPLMFLYREPVKFTLFLTVVFPLMAGLTYACVYSSLRNLATRVAVAIVFLCVPIVTGWPLLSGWAFSVAQGQQTRVAIPEYWFQATAYINRVSDRRERVLVLPQDGFYQTFYRWGFNGVDRIAETSIYSPIVRITADQNSYLENHYGAAMIGMIDHAFRYQNGSWLRTELQRASIGYIILRGDLVTDGRSLSVAESRFALARAGALPIAHFGPLDIYRVPELPAVSVPAAILRSCASPEGELAAAMRLPVNIAVVRSDTPHCRANHSYFQRVRASGMSFPAQTLVLRESGSFEPARTLGKRHNVQLRGGTMLDVSAEVLPSSAFAQSNGRSTFAGAWKPLVGTGAVMRRCLRVGGGRYLTFAGAPSPRNYVLWIAFMASPSCPNEVSGSFPVLEQRREPTIATVIVPEGSRSAVLIARPKSGIGRVDRPIRFTPSLTLRDVFARTPTPSQVPVTYETRLPLAPRLSVYGVSWPSDIVFRLPDGRELDAYVYRTGSSSPDLRIDDIFERIFQATSPEIVRLRTSDVILERIIPMTSTRLADRLIATAARGDDGWSLERLQRPKFLRPRTDETIYAGVLLKNQSTAEHGTLGPWWNSAQVDASPNTWVVMHQSYSDEWTADGAATQAVADGYGNAWYTRNGKIHAHVSLNAVEIRLVLLAAVSFVIIAIAVFMFRRRIDQVELDESLPELHQAEYPT